jgi:small subunit ribosomal protein S17e
MGRIRTHDIKKVSFELVERYKGRFTNDFTANKEVINELKIATSKKLRNKIAGYVTRVAKRKPKL